MKTELESDRLSIDKPLHPYDWQKVHIDLFYGRDELVGEMLKGLDRAKSYAVCGGRRMGKTTLLRYLEFCRGNMSDSVYIDLKSKLLLIDDYEDLLGILVDSVTDLLSSKVPAKEGKHKVTLDAFRTWILGIVRALPSRRLVFLVDEPDVILVKDWGKDFFSYLRSLVSDSEVANYLAVVLCGGQRLRELARLGGSPFNIATWTCLESFDLHGSKRLITEPLGLCISDEIIGEIFEFSGGHPYIIQYMMSYILDNLTSVSEDAVQAAENNFVSTQNFQLRNWWLELEDDDRRLYRFLYSVNQPVDFASCHAHLGSVAEPNIETLVACGLARYDDNTRNTCRVNCKAFQEWFASNEPQESSDASEEQNSQSRVFTPGEPYSNVARLREILSQCREYVWWYDPHFRVRALQELARIADPCRIHEIRILSKTEMFDEDARSDFRRFRKEMNAKGIEADWRTIAKSVSHDRYVIGANVTYNMPPVGAILQGTYCEGLETPIRPPFEQWWEEATNES